ncbi:L-2,4-diaminobutyric acid acetyltransferase [Sphingobium sp. OAS761]|nr:L-2,4-diaminobutyric acid acetyltransferase [Sphingobium sp. OAS761]
MLQCTDFAATCVVAELQGDVVGWVSGYRPPAAPENFFIWQVAVSSAARGRRLASRMVEAVLARPQQAGVTHLTTTVTQDNRASWALFEGLARTWGTTLEKTVRFDREAHFAGAHATEFQARIGPLTPKGRHQQEEI